MSPSPAIAAPATVINDAGCLMVDGNNNPVVVTFDSLAVGTASDNCNSTIQCKASGVTPSSTGRTVKFTDFLCSTTFGLTTRTQEVVTKSGQASLVCHVNTCP
ncbi:MAG: hypothetical protein ACREQF_02740 [Candidatus Binataceae bacterium]